MSHATIRSLPAGLLSQPVRGRNLRGTTLGENLADGPHLVAFLRHFG
ncbi:MAG: hypothetical protein AAF682_25615 [Planctomycetota bacterium]